MGALSRYVSTENGTFQPMNANFGILPAPEKRIRDKALRKAFYAERSAKDIKAYALSVESALKE